MKYCVLIIDGAAGWAMPEHGGRTCLELASTPNLDAMASEGAVGLARTVPAGMEPSSACACMSLLGYDPTIYYRGRSAIEARSIGIGTGENDVLFRCNLVAVRDGRMWSYSAGHITSTEARELVEALNEHLGSRDVHFYAGAAYRQICKISGHEETLQAVCTPPHDIPDKPVAEFMPRGPGSEFLIDLMNRSETVLHDHPVNIARRRRGDVPATTIWLFWSAGKIPEMPAFNQVYGLNVAMTSGVDLLRGLAQMAGMDVLHIDGVTDNVDNNYAGQATGALKALNSHDMVFIHIEAPDESGHSGSVSAKTGAIEMVDREVIARIRSWGKGDIRVLIMPDHATPIKKRTHTDEPVPFVIWGHGIAPNGARRLTEAEGAGTGLCIDPGYSIMRRLIAQRPEK